MDIIDFYNMKIDPIDDVDIRNGYYMRDILGYEKYRTNKLSEVSLKDAFIKSLMSFNIYKDRSLLESVYEKKAHFDYYPKNVETYYFNTLVVLGENHQIVPAIVYPTKLDEASYAFFGHEFHHCIKDIYPDERSIRDRVSEAIPMFYEMLCSDYEENEVVSKEIRKRRLALLQLDKNSESNEIGQIQYFNSFYYALALYNIYRNDSNKVLILRLVSRVLKGEITSLDLLEMLDLYGVNLDEEVSCELDKMKEYVLE